MVYWQSGSRLLGVMLLGEDSMEAATRCSRRFGRLIDQPYWIRFCILSYAAFTRRVLELVRELGQHRGRRD